MKDDEFRIPKWVWFIIIVVALLFLFIIYVASLGQVDYIFKSDEKEEELKERKRVAEARHAKLEKHIDHYEKEKERIGKWFYWIYFSVRFLIVGAWIGFNFILYSKFDVTTIGDLLNWNETVLLCVVAFVFLFYRNLTNLNDMLKFVRNRVENWVYGRFVSEEKMNEKIDLFKEEKDLVKQQVVLLDTQINNNKTS